MGGRFGDGGLPGLEQLFRRVAARRFGEVRRKDLGRLPVRVVVELLKDDGLVAGSEDEVYWAVTEYVEAREARCVARDGGGGELSEEERRALWGCCRFAYCSAGVQARLVLLAEAARDQGLMAEYLKEMVAERMAREGCRPRGEGGGLTSPLTQVGLGASQMRPQNLNFQVCFNPPTPAASALALSLPQAPFFLYVSFKFAPMGVFWPYNA